MQKEIIPFECIDIYNFILSIFVNQPPPMILSKYSTATICVGVINFYSMFDSIVMILVYHCTATTSACGGGRRQ